jgi:hypothetical protein
MDGCDKNHSTSVIMTRNSDETMKNEDEMQKTSPDFNNI